VRESGRERCDGVLTRSLKCMQLRHFVSTQPACENVESLTIHRDVGRIQIVCGRYEVCDVRREFLTSKQSIFNIVAASGSRPAQIYHL
jgi:tRNA G37 N-methylase TrmD